MEATNNDNFTIDIHRAINALNMSHDKNVKTNKVMKQTLHHKNIWDFAIVGVIGMAVGIIIIMAIKFNTDARKQKTTIDDLKKWMMRPKG